MARRFDFKMLYAECENCGQPVILEPEQTEDVLLWSGVDPLALDAACMILSEGCPNCDPEEEYYATHVVRLKADGVENAARML